MNPKGYSRLHPMEKILAVIFLFTPSDGNVFTVEPGPGPLQGFLGTEVELTCSVSWQYLVGWQFNLPGLAGPLDTLQHLSSLTVLKDRRIVVHNTSLVDSRVTVDGMEANNGTMVRCVALPVNVSLPAVLILAQERVQIYFHDPSITHLVATVVGLGTLGLTWWFPIPTQYTLTIVNLNDSTSNTVALTHDRNYMFTARNVPFTSCDLYRFRVAVLNNADIQSAVITKSVPSLPDVSLLEGSLQHSLLPTAQNEFTLHVTFNRLASCPEYPVHNYTLVVEDSAGNRTIQTSQATGDIVNITIPGLIENTRYSYHVIATNQFGPSPASTPVIIATTDVQNVSICQLNTTTYTIQCIYLNGSDSRGCVFILVSREEEVEDITGTIPRSNHNGVAIELSDIMDFNVVLAFDLEEGNAISTVPLSVTIRAATSVCPTAANVSTQCEVCPSCSTSTALASVITAIATALLATVIFVLVQIAVCKCHPKFTPETGTSAGGEGQEYEEVDGGGGGGAVSDPTYMEVDGGGGRGGNTFQLKENEAYASTMHN